jgi:hypothetical protein
MVGAGGEMLRPQPDHPRHLLGRTRAGDGQHVERPPFGRLAQPQLRDRTGPAPIAAGRATAADERQPTPVTPQPQVPHILRVFELATRQGDSEAISGERHERARRVGAGHGGVNGEHARLLGSSQPLDRGTDRDGRRLASLRRGGLNPEQHLGDDPRAEASQHHMSGPVALHGPLRLAPPSEVRSASPQPLPAVWTAQPPTIIGPAVAGGDHTAAERHARPRRGEAVVAVNVGVHTLVAGARRAVARLAQTGSKGRPFVTRDPTHHTQPLRGPLASLHTCPAERLHVLGPKDHPDRVAAGAQARGGIRRVATPVHRTAPKPEHRVGRVGLPHQRRLVPARRGEHRQVQQGRHVPGAVAGDIASRSVARRQRPPCLCCGRHVDARGGSSKRSEPTDSTAPRNLSSEGCE